MVSVRKIATCMLLGTLTFAAHTDTAKAEETPVAGINLLFSDQDSSTQTYSSGVQTILLSDLKAQEVDLAFAKVDDYINIRSEANEESTILGKLYKDNLATVLQKEGEWYLVKSGAVTGYIKEDFLITGKKAITYAKKAGSTLATIDTKILRVRKKATTKSKVLTRVPRGEEYTVTKDMDEWVRITIDDNTTGYVSKDYVKLKKVYSLAVSMEEEAEAAVQATSLMSVEGSDTSQKSEKSYIRDKITNFARRFEGNPYVWGGTSLTRGADCSGFTQSVFENFGIDIPRTSREQAVSGQRVDIDDIKPGDLIFYRKNGIINHVALYIGNGKVIGAKSKDEGIRISKYNYRTPYKAVNYIG